MKRLLDYLNTLTLRAYVKLQILAATEPVRLRSVLTSAALALAFFVPSLAQPDITDHLVTFGAVALPILVGESARKKVAPVDDEE
ncbi:hypothetical protein ACTFBT_01220 [Streptomyces microflavus]|uniref:Uncharacterized protein n=1 Tax=Streptomyces microflavus TaxID=1919 RepID=A0A7J0D494_STRMI|nr:MULTISPECIES: hypothetical protein [Streptomyces]MDX2978153.1 hypothetical protein [Streptomyces sp. NRRL_B-2249]GFN09556.1 hypothetical protein Smic_81120 [Streptomyces microflavus]GGX67174.1 hypothetical protein GCM10010298_34880 [Streptomyces microflavus]